MSYHNQANGSIALRIASLIAVSALTFSIALLAGCNSEKPIGQQIAETANKIPGITVTYEDDSKNSVSNYSPAKPGVKIRNGGKTRTYSFRKAGKAFSNAGSIKKINKKFPNGATVCVVGYVQKIVKVKEGSESLLPMMRDYGIDHFPHSNIYGSYLYVIGEKNAKKASPNDLRFLAFAVDDPATTIEDLKKGDVVRAVGPIEEVYPSAFLGQVVRYDNIMLEGGRGIIDPKKGTKFVYPNNCIMVNATNPGASVSIQKYDFASAKK